MKILRLWRQYDSIKAAIMLLALAAFLIGYCIHAAISYAVLLQTPTEYICAADGDTEKHISQLMQLTAVRGYSQQKTVYLSQNEKSLNVTQLSAAYLADIYGITDSSRMIWANASAFASFCGDTETQSLRFQGELDGKPFSAEIVCTDALPNAQPTAVMSVNVSALHNAAELRICMADQDTALLGQLGLTIHNSEILCTAKYEQELVLLRIRFGMLSVFLCCIAAGAFLRYYRLIRENERHIHDV